MAAIDATFPRSPRALVSDFAHHIADTVKPIGIDHAGISADFDGGGVTGYDDASASINVMSELVWRGNSKRDIIALWDGNPLRVMAQVENVAEVLR